MAWRLWVATPQPYWKRQLIAVCVAITLIGLGAQLWAPDSDAPLPAGWGGIVPLILGNAVAPLFDRAGERSEEHTSELQSLMRISYAVFCLKKKKTNNTT